MKVVAYSIQPYEKECLIKANQKKHDITLISNPLSLDTVAFAEGKDAVLVFTDDDVSARVINRLADLGVRFIATRSVDTQHIDKTAAGQRNLKLAFAPGAKIPVDLSENLNAASEVANQTIKNLDLWQQEKCVGDACACARNCRAVSHQQQAQSQINIPLP